MNCVDISRHKQLWIGGQIKLPVTHLIIISKVLEIFSNAVNYVTVLYRSQLRLFLITVFFFRHHYSQANTSLNLFGPHRDVELQANLFRANPSQVHNTGSPVTVYSDRLKPLSLNWNKPIFLNTHNLHTNMIRRFYGDHSETSSCDHYGEKY